MSSRQAYPVAAVKRRPKICSGCSSPAGRFHGTLKLTRIPNVAWVVDRRRFPGGSGPMTRQLHGVYDWLCAHCRKMLRSA